MAQRTGKGILIAACLWIVIIGALGAAFRHFVYPQIEKKLSQETGSTSQYRTEITLALDSFSGYCILRSEAFARMLREDGIRLTISDDKADYESRAKALRKGDVQMAVFPIDSLIKTGAMLGEFPATIVAIIDETRGADAIVARKDTVANLEGLNHPDARIVLTPDSPSEFLSRTVIAHFSMPNLPTRWWINADGASDVYRRFRSSKQGELRAYALWEPYVSMALETGNAHVLIDSSQLRGYIVDVLVVRREFLRNNHDLVKNVVASYLRAAHSYNQGADGMLKLVMEDSVATGERLSKQQAEKIIAGVQWKNTLENYAHFGVLPAAESRGLQHLEHLIGNIANVLLKTEAVASNPVEGKVHLLFYDRIMRELHSEDFHPGRKLNIIDIGTRLPELEDIRADAELPPLTDAQWKSLLPVGRVNVEPIAFRRGTSELNIQSKRDLEQLANHLKSWPRYYMILIGHARAEGDTQANIALANARAEAAVQHLISCGVNPNRIKAKAAEPSDAGGAAQSVSFFVGQVSY